MYDWSELLNKRICNRPDVCVCVLLIGCLYYKHCGTACLFVIIIIP
jgi:hypothetical protein